MSPASNLSIPKPPIRWLLIRKDRKAWLVGYLCQGATNSHNNSKRVCCIWSAYWWKNWCWSMYCGSEQGTSVLRTTLEQSEQLQDQLHNLRFLKLLLILIYDQLTTLTLASEPGTTPWNPGHWLGIRYVGAHGSLMEHQEWASRHQTTTSSYSEGFRLCDWSLGGFDDWPNCRGKEDVILKNLQ